MKQRTEAARRGAQVWRFRRCQRSRHRKPLDGDAVRALHVGRGVVGDGGRTVGCGHARLSAQFGADRV